MSSERGAILIQVAVAGIVLIAFSMFVIDYGIMWVSRGEAQNAADSGALAGATALAYDDFDNRLDDGPAKQAAQQFALLNHVFGEDPDVQVSTDVIFYDDDPSKFPDSCSDDTCIRVDVYRNQARANPLPMIFGQLVGLSDQGVRATATAQIYAGNAAECVKPWVVADRWSEGGPMPVPWTQSNEFNIADDGEPDPEDVDIWDEYVPGTYVGDPPVYTPGTGFGATDASGNLVDYGYQFLLRMANPGGGSTLGVRSPGWVMTLDLPNEESGGGENEVLANISGCTDAIVTIADPGDACDEPSPEVPDPDTGLIIMTCVGVQTGNAWNPQEGALEEWFGDDIGDYWDATANDGAGAPSNINSKRIIPLALFDPYHYASHGFTGSNGVVKIVNVLGFFVEGTCDGSDDIDVVPFFHEPYLECSASGPANDLVGRLVSIPGLAIGNGGSIGPASFTKVIRLIR